MRTPIKVEATLVGVRHQDWQGGSPVEEVLSAFKKRFRSRIKPGRTLFIEHPQSQMVTYPWTLPEIKGYELIVHHALKKGMNVFALDTPMLEKIDAERGKKRREFENFWVTMLKKYKTETSWMTATAAMTRNHYLMTMVRERRWANLLKQAKKGDLIVMHPIHAWRIAPRLGIEREEIAFLHSPDKEVLADIETYLAPEKVNLIRRLWREHMKEELEKRKRKIRIRNRKQSN